MRILGPEVILEQTVEPDTVISETTVVIYPGDIYIDLLSGSVYEYTSE